MLTVTCGSLPVITSASHSITWHTSLLMALEGFPFYTATKRGRSGMKWEGSDWSVSKGKAGGKAGVWMSGLLPDTR